MVAVTGRMPRGVPARRRASTSMLASSWTPTWPRSRRLE